MAPRILHRHAVMISDLHVGSPENARLEDFDRDADFERLLGEIIPARAGGPATLIIAGDFIDFPQILPEIGKRSPGERFGTTEAESVARVERAIAGHPRVFEALGAFVAGGNQALHFPGVLATLRAAAGDPAPPALDFVAEGALQEGSHAPPSGRPSCPPTPEAHPPTGAISLVWTPPNPDRRPAAE